ncbi:LysM peptidoglycan-binding domain-containing M23 family metallopeptidase [Fuscovulum blasticum]|uniref:LysM peptidoglycan-binding domain-containing M23 family metallopeptidase n=1 Tax=Fuscovulum blasticum TaxID=1075 RepID=UPI000D3EDF8C|nr:peptidase M23 [Fuscovulum blasticum]
MTDFHSPPRRPQLRAPQFRLLAAGSALALLGACANAPMGQFDWDLRSGAGGTAEEARQATASKPVPDSNGVLSYPGYQLAQARRGDTVASVAARLGVNPAELARANALQPNDPLRAGEMLLLPSRVSATPQPVAPTATAGSRPVDITAIATTALDDVGPSPSASVPGGGKEPLRHRVVRGETAFTIARAYNVSAKSLAEWNSLDANMTVREGQTLIIPVATAAAPNPEPVPTPPGSGSPTPEPPSAAKPLPNEKTEPASAKAKDTPPSPDLGADRTGASAAKLGFPVQGKIIRGYDKKKNQGIDISAPAGTAVKAAGSGTVAAITKDTDQVQIVVIRHADNLLTVYAGVDALKVKKGDKVSRGQTIGAVRKADPAFLHFEVRKGVDSLDPMTFLQ